jgi:DNA polymerase-3 subunit delta'
MRGAKNGDETAALPSRANPDLVGHELVEALLVQLYRAGRLPHAILIAGPRGIGKATLAFRLARFLLARGGEGASAAPATSHEPGLAIDPESGVFRRVAAGSHADLLTIERAWDPRRGRLRNEIVVDDAREIAAFFRLSSAEEGWRIVIVDGAEEMNRNAANALLKILEEPPDHSLLVLVSHNPGRLLPTIRSRCRRLVLSPPAMPVASRLLRHYRPQLDNTQANALSTLSGGSIGRALELADAGGLELYSSLMELLASVPAIDVGRLHALADRLARTEADDTYRACEELLGRFLARLAREAARGRLDAEKNVPGEATAISCLSRSADPARWAALGQEIETNFAAARELNLDKKQTLLGAFFAIEATAR